MVLGITHKDRSGRSPALTSAGSVPQMALSWQGQGPGPAWTSAGSTILAHRLLQGLGQALRRLWALGLVSRSELIIGTLAVSHGGKAPQRQSRHLLGRHGRLVRCFEVIDVTVVTSDASISEELEGSTSLSQEILSSCAVDFGIQHCTSKPRHLCMF